MLKSNSLGKLLSVFSALLTAVLLLALPLYGFAAEVSDSRPESPPVPECTTPATIRLPDGCKLLYLDGERIAALPTGLFSFNVVESVTDGGSATGAAFSPTIKADGRIVFGGPITITRAGTYAYTISENPVGDSRYIADPAVFTVTYKIVERGRSLAVKPGYPVITRTVGSETREVCSIAFFNTYNPTPVVISLDGQKNLYDNGGSSVELLENQFGFTCIESRSGGEGSFTPRDISVLQAADGGLSFICEGSAGITIRRTGSYTYTIHETDIADPHYQNDGRYYAVTFEVTDNDGQLVASDPVIYIYYECSEATPADEVYFENLVTPDTATSDFGAIKKLSGITSSTVEWHFVLEAVSSTAADMEPADMPMPDGSVDGKKTVSLVGSGSLSFGSVTYEKAGVYVYKIYELPASEAHYVSDGSVFTVTDTVSLDGTTLTVARSVSKVGSSSEYAVPEFTNRYVRVPDTGDGGLLPVVICSAISLSVIIALALLKRRVRQSAEK